MKYHIEEYELFNEKRIDAVLDHENPVLQDWMNDDFRQFHKWYMDDFKEVIDGKKENGGPSANTQKQQAPCTYQWKYRKYIGKTIKLKLKDGDVLVGKVDSISSPGDNDNGEEGILLDTSIGLQEFFEREIESVEVEST